MSVSLVWSTPNTEQVVVDCARVSSPKQAGEPGTRLLAYLMLHKHWSPFEMASACVEIHTTRAISRQILRHKSFSFQEFSTRYAAVADGPVIVNARAQDEKNRQASHDTLPNRVKDDFTSAQLGVWNVAKRAYDTAIASGVAKECARALLPEGMPPTRMYMAGNMRSWIHYIDVRCGIETQLEHRHVAFEVRGIVCLLMPSLAPILRGVGQKG